MTDPNELEPFDGQEVAAATIAVTRAGDGLSEALSIEPRPFHLGEKVYVVLETEVGKIIHKPLDPKAPQILTREHVLVAGVGTIVDREAVEQLVASQRTRNVEAAEAREIEARRAKGGYTLEEALAEKAHDDGGHAAGLVKGCPKCDTEKAAAAAEVKDEGAVAPIAGRKAPAKKAPAKKAPGPK